MSLMLKGIDLPSENNSIIVEIFPSGECSTMEIEKGECYEFCLNGNTEAIQIPRDHGNIIDESKAVVTETIDGYYEITAPTILEAEEENDG